MFPSLCPDQHYFEMSNHMCTGGIPPDTQNMPSRKISTWYFLPVDESKRSIDEGGLITRTAFSRIYPPS